MEFLHHWRLIKRIGGWLDMEPCRFLFETAKNNKIDGVILEIGAFKGRSTVCMALGSKCGSNTHVYSIDPFKPFQLQDGSYWNNAFRDEFLFNVLKSGVINLVTSIVDTSDNAAVTWNLPIALLFIDGDHSYDQVKKDYENFSKFVVPGGVIALHDTDQYPSVKQLLIEVRCDKPVIKLTNMTAWVVE